MGRFRAAQRRCAQNTWTRRSTELQLKIPETTRRPDRPLTGEYTSLYGVRSKSERQVSVKHCDRGGWWSEIRSLV